MYWGWILKFPRNVDISEAILFHFSDIIHDVKLSEGGALDRDGIVLLSEDENLVYV